MSFKQITKIQIVSIIVFSLICIANADEISKPHEFAEGEAARASEVNANFDVIYYKVNELGEVIDIENGNVGIGNTNPTEKLDVAGKVKAVSFEGDGRDLTNVQCDCTGSGDGMPPGAIIMWSGTTIPTGWKLCDGTDGTPDLTDRFVIGAGGEFASGLTGGAKSNDLSHSHSIDAQNLTVSQSGDHTHPVDITSQPNTKIDTVEDHSINEDNVQEDNHTHRVMGDTGNAGTHSHTVSGSLDIAPASLSSVENLPPYYAVYFIMKE